MPLYYMFVRPWLGVSKRFPFQLFDELPDAELPAALDRLARQWAEEHPQGIDEYRAELRARALGTMSPPGSRSTRRLHDALEADSKRLLEFWQIADLAGWREGHVVANPGPREFFARVETEEQARLVVSTLQRLHPRLGIARARYGFLNADGLARDEQLALDLAVEDRQQRRVFRDPLKPLIEDTSRILNRLRTFVEQEREEDHPAKSDEIASAAADPEKVKLSRTEEMALASYTWVQSKYPREFERGVKNYSQAYKLLQAAIDAGECPHYSTLKDLPSFGTWERYVRKGLSADASSSKSLRRGREHGPSIAEGGTL